MDGYLKTTRAFICICTFVVNFAFSREESCKKFWNCINRVCVNKLQARPQSWWVYITHASNEYILLNLYIWRNGETKCMQTACKLNAYVHKDTHRHHRDNRRSSPALRLVSLHQLKWTFLIGANVSIIRDGGHNSYFIQIAESIIQT